MTFVRQVYSPIRGNTAPVRLLRGEPRTVGKLHLFHFNHHMKHFPMSVPGPAVLPRFRVPELRMLGVGFFRKRRYRRLAVVLQVVVVVPSCYGSVSLLRRGVISSTSPAGDQVER